MTIPKTISAECAAKLDPSHDIVVAGDGYIVTGKIPDAGYAEFAAFGVTATEGDGEAVEIEPWFTASVRFDGGVHWGFGAGDGCLYLDGFREARGLSAAMQAVLQLAHDCLPQFSDYSGREDVASPAFVVLKGDRPV